ncbi:MAG: amidase family protein, partial [Solirubrobacteraceae bacterium]|nr:amidase family protein [Solirubrobacteraceae bacterium]
DDVQLAADFLLIWFVGSAQGVDAVKEITGCGDEGFEQDTLITAALGRATRVMDYAGALERRHAYVQRLAEFHDRYDLLLTPTLSTLQPKVGSFDQPRALERGADVLLKLRIAGQLRRTPIMRTIIENNLRWCPFTQLANLTGRPAMSVPLHQTAAGLPVGMQFVAPLGEEGRLLRLAGQLEEVRPWSERLPAL